MLTTRPQRGQKHPVYIVQGAQWGSEGKGQIAAIYAETQGAKAVVRTGSINAGHTVYHKGKSFKMQLLPTAWVVPKPQLVLGPACSIHRGILEKELTIIAEETSEDPRNRLLIDYRCTTHEPRHEVASKASGRHHEMGSTSKGSSDAVIDRMNARGNLGRAKMLLFRNDPTAGKWDLSKCICDTSSALDGMLAFGPIVLEGTQGAHLDMFTGPYPFVSNRTVSTAAWLAYAGLSPTLDVRPILVARTFPIRVAGNSGPMPGECTWEDVYGLVASARAAGYDNAPYVPARAFVEYDLALRKDIAFGGGPNKRICDWTDEERYTHKHLLSEAPTRALSIMPVEDRDALLTFVEKTTVTHKIRRIAYWTSNLIEEAIRLNGCFEMWITFLNYKYPSVWNSDTTMRIAGTPAWLWLQETASLFQVPIAGVSTGPEPKHHLPLNLMP